MDTTDTHASYGGGSGAERIVVWILLLLACGFWFPYTLYFLTGLLGSLG